MTAAISARLTSATSTARRYSATGPWIGWEHCGDVSRTDSECTLTRKNNIHSTSYLALPLTPVKIYKIHLPENECRRSWRWKMVASSAAKATARTPNVTAKLFL